MHNPPNTQASLSTRFKVWYESIPVVTRYVMSLCVIVYVSGLLFGQYTFELCMSPYIIVFNYEVWRLLTSVFLHGGILHILFNMMAFLPMGKQLEVLIGSTNFLHLILVFSLLSNVMNTSIALLVWYNPFYSTPFFLIQCGVGFSGVLFGLIVIQTQISRAETQSIFGLFTVPTKYYPWILLVFLQVLMANVSFLGHLCGILCGYAYMYGYLNGFNLSPSTVAKIEKIWPFSFLASRALFISNPASGSPGFSSAFQRSAPSESQGNSSNSSGYFGRMFQGSQSSTANQSQLFQGTGRALGGSQGNAPSYLVQNIPPPQSYLPPRRENSQNERAIEMEPLMSQINSTQELNFSVTPNQARQIMSEMGYPPEAAEKALQSTNYDVERAVQLLDSSQ